jgi:hypothetical protein
MVTVWPTYAGFGVTVSVVAVGAGLTVSVSDAVLASRLGVARKFAVMG